MSGRGRGMRVISDWRKGAFAPRYILAGLIVLVCVVFIPSVASADVDSVGGLEKVPTIKSSPHELTPLAGGAGLYQCSSAYQYADVHSEPWGFVIGQCRPGWKFEVLEHTGVNSQHHTSSYGGYLEGAFDACGWIESDEGPEQINEKLPNHCPGLNQKKSTVGTFYEKYNGQPEPTGDGYYIVNKVPCKEYANFRPWSSESVEKEEIRTVPAYALGGEHHFEHEPALKWRYVTEYASTDGSGKYVMVRDDRYNGGEGNWVFVPLSCLRANASELPTGEGEYVPSPPTVTTGTPTGIATPNATLVGFVNPNGVSTKYYFEYTTSPTFETVISTPTGEAGSGTSVVQEDAPISGLAPGTTYYFRIVASSATGETRGGPVSFKTQPPPTVTTTAASAVLEEQATLNGTVNGNGLNTTYHFEYGETIPYGSSTPAVEVGSGSSSPGVSVTGLKPDTTYHYRIVATSTAGTSVGEDHSFTTLYNEASSTWVIRDGSTGNQFAFYRGGIGLLDETYYVAQTNGWASAVLGGEMAASTLPSVIRDARTGNISVFYHGLNGLLDETYYIAQTNGWASVALGGEMASGASPNVVRDPSTGNVYVFYKGANGLLDETYYVAQANGWASAVLGGEMASGANPGAVRAQSTGNMYVFYKGANGSLDETYYVAQTNGWASVVLGGEMAASTSPSVLRDPSTGNMYVFYHGVNGLLDETYYVAQTNGWASVVLGGEMAASTSPSVLRDPSTGNMYVFYHGVNGLLDETYYVAQTDGWASAVLGGEVAGGASPSAVRAQSTGNIYVFYKGTNRLLDETYYVAQSNGWASAILGGEMG
jgi:myo-inositol-hexaphosphate 3-phosphohydrolase